MRIHLRCHRPSVAVPAVAIALSLLSAVSAVADQPGQEPPAPVTLPGLEHTAPFFPGADHDPAVATAAELLGFDVGERFPSPEEIARCLAAWSDASPRVTVTEYARTHEDRPLHYVVITSPENHARLAEIQQGWQRLADPRGMDRGEADRLLDGMPGIGWFAYSIHGNETSGADCALAVIHHLAADRTVQTRQWLDDLVIIIDPLMNPDGRARFHQQVTEFRSTTPSVDDQSLLHRGDWPSARTNHYFFDLNRDWILGVHPETRGRMRAIGDWLPLLLVDGHEMGSQDTYLMSPPREPINPHYPASRLEWGEVFAQDHAQAFDRHGWPYYMGEWNDEWYPGYSAWAAYRGGLFILYEQPRVAEDAIRRPDGSLLSYREAIHHQIVSTVANLETFHRNRDAMKRDFLAQRRQSVGADGPYADLTYAVLPSENTGRFLKLLELLDLQDIEMHVAEQDLEVRRAVDQYGVPYDRFTLPAGTVLIPNRQPEAYLVAALLDFDPRMNDETLKEERRSLLRRGRSLMYDTTAWNLTMLYGLDAVVLPTDLPRGTRRLATGEIGAVAAMGAAGAGSTGAPADAVAWCFDGADDRSVAVAARLLEQDLTVRAANESFAIGGREFSRGTVVVTAYDNAGRAPSVEDLVQEAGEAWGLAPATVATGLSPGLGADLGGRHFRRLEKPRVALIGRGAASTGDFGAIWHALDRELGLRHSHLDENGLGRSDLRRYNVLVLPHRYGGGLPDGLGADLAGWVRDGGTLIAVGRAAVALTNPEIGPSGARNLADVVDDLDPYRLQIQREWLAHSAQTPPAESVWAHTAPAELPLGWPELPGKGSGRSTEGSDDENGDRPAAGHHRPPADAAARDRWLAMFMPQGAFLAARADTTHWLTFGCGETMPILTGSGIGTGPVLMTTDQQEAPVRFGVFRPAEDAPETASMVGWSPVPPGHELLLRMGGLLWPEATHRLASSAYVTRERVGRGQIILFATPPAFRGASWGSLRLLLNAVVYGPGMGASHPIRP